VKYFSYQTRMLKRLLSGASFMVWILPGGGKTIPILRWIYELKARGDKPKVLLISTELIIWNVWPDEITRFQRFRALRYFICHKHRLEKTVDHIYADDFDIIAMTPDTLVNMLEYYPDAFRQFNKLVVDECTKFKNPVKKKRQKTNRFWALRDILKKNPQIDQRICMTGTPQPNGELQLFSQFWIVGKEKMWGGNSYYADFLNLYFFKPQYSFKDKLLPGAAEKIDNIIAPWIFQPRADEYRKMPPLLEYIWHVTLPPAAAKLHKEMLKYKAIRIQGKGILADNSAVAQNKCVQIASGVVYRWDDPNNPAAGKEPLFVHNQKDLMLQDIVEDAGGANVLILYNYVHEYDRIKQEYPDSMDISKDKGAIQAWNRRQILIATAHPASMAHGLNLQEGGNILIFFSPPDDLELVEQVKKRLHRGMITEPVYVNYIIARKTKDERRMALLDEKSALQKHRMAQHEGR
jgi:hypothetical protein